MIDIVINYDPGANQYKIYESSTKNLIISQDLTESLVTLSMFLSSQGLIQGDILGAQDITYHLDSQTMKSVIESNVKLLKRLKSAPSGFTLSSQRFGGSISSSSPRNKKDSWGKGSEGKFKSRNSTFSGASGFKQANKKFGNKK